MANGLVMPAQETKVGMLPCEMLNSWRHVTFGTQVAQWIRNAKSNFVHTVGFQNGPHKFLHQQLGAWVCKLPLPSHFWLSRWRWS